MNFGHGLIIQYSMYIMTHIMEIYYNLKVCSFPFSCTENA